MFGNKARMPDSLYTGTTGAGLSDHKTLTLDVLIEKVTKIERLPVLYYADDRHCPKVDEDGQPVFFLLEQARFNPETVIFHPDYWTFFHETMRDAGWRMEHLRECATGYALQSTDR